MFELKIGIVSYFIVPQSIFLVIAFLVIFHGSLLLYAYHLHLLTPSLDSLYLGSIMC